MFLSAAAIGIGVGLGIGVPALFVVMLAAIIVALRRQRTKKYIPAATNTSAALIDGDVELHVSSTTPR